MAEKASSYYIQIVVVSKTSVYFYTQHKKKRFYGWKVPLIIATLRAESLP